jgi:HAD superfamily hydrolase (TIGR01509 family)
MKDLPSLLAGKQLLIFDFDGTVADTTPLHADAFSMVLSPMGIAVNYPELAGLKTLDAMRKCLVDAYLVPSDEELLKLVSAKQQAVRYMISRELSTLPGVDEFLRWARPCYRLGMATSGSRGTVELALQKLGYVGWFEPLVCADDVLNAKPDPEGFLTVLKMTGTKAADALVFEDSTAGFAAAQAAGLAYVDARQNLWQQLVGTGSVA